nr:VanZ family protein [uncultured Roseovarius sp.]
MQARRGIISGRVAWWLTAALVLLIGFVTLTPIPQMQTMSHSDKLQHFVAFSVLALPLSLAYPRYFLGVFIAAVAYGGLIEVIQPHVGRSAEMLDVLADAAGALAGGIVGRYVGLWQGAGRISRAR